MAPLTCPSGFDVLAHETKTYKATHTCSPALPAGVEIDVEYIECGCQVNCTCTDAQGQTGTGFTADYRAAARVDNSSSVSASDQAAVTKIIEKDYVNFMLSRKEKANQKSAACAAINATTSSSAATTANTSIFNHTYPNHTDVLSNATLYLQLQKMILDGFETARIQKKLQYPFFWPGQGPEESFLIDPTATAFGFSSSANTIATNADASQNLPQALIDRVKNNCPSNQSCSFCEPVAADFTHTLLIAVLGCEDMALCASVKVTKGKKPYVAGVGRITPASDVGKLMAGYFLDGKTVQEGETEEACKIVQNGAKQSYDSCCSCPQPPCTVAPSNATSYLLGSSASAGKNFENPNAQQPPDLSALNATCLKNPCFFSQFGRYAFTMAQTSTCNSVKAEADNIIRTAVAEFRFIVAKEQVLLLG